MKGLTSGLTDLGIRDCSVVGKQDVGDPPEEHRGCAVHRGLTKAHYDYVSSFTAPVVKQPAAVLRSCFHYR